MRTAIPITYRIKRLISGKRLDHADICDESWELSPAVNKTLSPAKFLDGELEKVTSVSEFTTWELEKKRVNSTKREQRATKAYRLKNATIINGYLYKGPMKEMLLEIPESLLPKAANQKIDKAVLACTYPGNRFFGHCLRDDFPLNLLAHELGEAITLKRQQFGHEPGYKTLCRISACEVQRVNCSELIVVDDIGYTESKQKRLQTIRTRLAESVADKTPPPGVMIRRGNTGQSRSLVNEAQVEETLRKRGFTIIDPAAMTVEEIVQKTSGTPIIVGVEGSHMNHGLLSLADRGTILTIQPPYRFNNVFKEFADCLDMTYALVVGTAVKGGFSVDVNKVMETLDLAQQS